MTYKVVRTDELYHHGVLGQKWGVRRYQNADGSLTAAGRKRYLNDDGSLKPNKKINYRDYAVNKTLSNVDKKTDKIYTLSKNQKKYMDEAGNLTLKGGRETLPIGYDLSAERYKKAKKEREVYSKSWETYFKNKTPENYDIFKKNQEKFFKELDEIDVEDGRQWILKNIK